MSQRSGSGVGLLRAASVRSNAASITVPAAAAAVCLRVQPTAVLATILKALLVVNSVPIVEWLIRGRQRRHLDAISALQVNFLDQCYISGVIIFKVKTDYATIVRAMEHFYIGEGCPSMFRFWREFPMATAWFWPYWKTDKDFQTSRHIHRCTDRMDHSSLEEWVADHQILDMDRMHPLWDFTIFENYVDETGKDLSAAVLKCHHCYGDGFTMLRMLMQAADPKRPACKNLPVFSQPAMKNSSGNISVMSNHEPRLEPLWPQKKDPNQKKDSKMTPIQAFGKSLGAVGKLLSMANDPDSPLKSNHFIAAEGKRHVAWHCLDHSVDDVKAIGRPYGQTVNDILIAALSTTLGKLASRGHGKVTTQVNIAMWCSLIPCSNLYKDPSELPLVNSNSGLGAVYLTVPLKGATGPKENCAEIATRIKKLIRSPEALLANRIMAFFGAWPRIVARPIWDALSNKVTASVSNMPGPQFPLSWLGVPIQSWLFFTPPIGTISTFVTIFTFDGRINFGLGGDASIMELDSLRQAVQVDFDEALQELKKAQA